MRTQQVVTIRPWEEVIGRVEDVLEDSVVLSFARERCTVLMGQGELKKWRAMLRKGFKVGILLLDDGSIRVRVVDGDGGA